MGCLSHRHRSCLVQNVWNVQWADDHPDYVAILDKSHMYIMRGESLEEPVLRCEGSPCARAGRVQGHPLCLTPVLATPSAGHVCSFRNLAVTSIVVSAVADEIRRSFVNEEHRGRAGLLTHLQDNVAQFDTRPLRDARTLLHVDLQEALHHAEQVDHEVRPRAAVSGVGGFRAHTPDSGLPQRVWKLVAEEALRQLDFTVAEAVRRARTHCPSTAPSYHPFARRPTWAPGTTRESTSPAACASWALTPCAAPTRTSCSRTSTRSVRNCRSAEAVGLR